MDFVQAETAPGERNVASAIESESREGFEALFRANSRLILAYALRRLERPEDAADVLSEVMVVAWRRRADLPTRDEVTPWLYGIARRVIANSTRADRRHSRLAEKLRAEVPAHASADHVADHAEVAGVRAALRRLPEVDREVLLLSAWEGLEPVQIAAVLDLTPAATRSRLHRARNRLRGELEYLSDASTSTREDTGVDASRKGPR